MAEKPIKTPLPADLPEDWNIGQTVAPDGTAVGLTEQHGYNYLMAAVNRAQRGVNEVNEAFGTVSGKRTCRFVVGTSTAGWTDADCDYLCDGTDDQVDIQQAVDALTAGGGEIILLSGAYQLSAAISIHESAGNIAFMGNPGSTIIKGGGLQFNSYGTSFEWTVEGIIFEGNGLNSINNSLTVKNCTFINAGVHFQQVQDNSFCTFTCCENRFLQSEPLNEQNGVVEVLKIAVGSTDSPSRSCVISDNIIEMTAGSTSQDIIVGIRGSEQEGMYAFTGNVILCNVKCRVLVSDSGDINGNIFYNCDVSSGGGNVIAGNQFFGCGISATNDRDQKKCSSVSGNCIKGGTISASGNVNVTGNSINLYADTGEEYAIRLYKYAPDSFADRAPLVVGNYLVGGVCGILLEEPASDFTNKTCANAIVNSNRIYGSQTPIKIGEHWSGCMVTDNLFTTGTIEDNGTSNIVRFNSDDPSTGGGSGGGGTAGVTTFNGRSGKVVPGNNDYTAPMVGAIPASAVKEIQSMTQSEYDALATKNATTLYLIKE